MLLRRINYNRILRRVILAMFAVMLIVTLPHLLGSFVKYHHGSHTARSYWCPNYTFCNSTPIPQPQEGIASCNQHRNANSLSSSERKIYRRLTVELCNLASRDNYRDRTCVDQPLTVSATKYSPAVTFLFNFFQTGHLRNLFVCTVAESAMRYDIDFVKAVYLGLDLPLRYIIPCLSLVVINTVLVVTVRKAQRRHSDISQTARKSLINMPVLRSALGIVFVFLVCHTGAAGLFVLDVIRAFAEQNTGFVGTSVNAFIKEDTATQGLEMKYSALLLAAINSSVNIALYCFFLPTFRSHWVLSFTPKQQCKAGAKPRKAIPDIIPLEEIQSESGSVS